eukprot:g675.t1
MAKPLRKKPPPPVNFAHKEILEPLKTDGASLTRAARDNDLETLLALIAAKQEEESITEIPTVKAFLDWANEMDGKQTALHRASIDGFVEIAEALMAAGATVNKRDHGGNMPLHLAALHHNREALEALVRGGADLDATERYGNDAAGIAEFYCDFETAKWLREEAPALQKQLGCRNTGYVSRAGRALHDDDEELDGVTPGGKGHHLGHAMHEDTLEEVLGRLFSELDVADAGAVRKKDLMAAIRSNERVRAMLRENDRLRPLLKGKTLASTFEKLDKNHDEAIELEELLEFCGAQLPAKKGGADGEEDEDDEDWNDMSMPEIVPRQMFQYYATAGPIAEGGGESGEEEDDDEKEGGNGDDDGDGDDDDEDASRQGAGGSGFGLHISEKEMWNKKGK